MLLLHQRLLLLTLPHLLLHQLLLAHPHLSNLRLLIKADLRSAFFISDAALKSCSYIANSPNRILAHAIIDASLPLFLACDHHCSLIRTKYTAECFTRKFQRIILFTY